MIIGLSGYAQVGKDTAAQIFERYGFAKYSFADPMREMAMAIDPIVYWTDGWDVIRYSDAVHELGYEQAKQAYPEVRKFLQRLGTDAGRAVLGEDIWVNTAMDQMHDGDYVVSDVRFPNEADAILRDGGAVFRITRPGYGPVNGHASETAMDNYPDFTDYVGNNDTISYLHQRVWDKYMRHTRTHSTSRSTAHDERPGDRDPIRTA